MAKPILNRLRSVSPSALLTMYTHTSSSVSGWHGESGANRVGYVPDPSRIRNVLERFCPQLILYPRADLWPPMVDGAARLSIPQVVAGGYLAETSRRLRWPGKPLHRRMMHQLAAVCSVSAEDAERWVELGAPRGMVHVTGDPRDDEILDHHPESSPSVLKEWGCGRFVLVAGSVHESDLRPLLEAAAKSSREIRLIVVPHDSGSDIAGRVGERADGFGLPHEIWRPGTQAPSPSTRVLCINTSGLLKALYGLGKVAYVGGGFGSSGVHSVAEAAVWGIPVIVGPGGNTQPEVERFLRREGLVSVANSRKMIEVINGWIVDDSGRRRAGDQAKACLQGGASARTAELLQQIITGRSV